EIQQIVFSSQRLTAYFDRFCFLLGHTFYSSRINMVFLVPLFATGIIAPFFKGALRAKSRERFLTLLLAVFFVGLTFYSLPMAWTRYVTSCLPFVILVGVQGAGLLIDATAIWSSLGTRIKAVVLSTLLVVAMASAVIKHDLGPRFCQVPRIPPPEHVFISKIFAYSLMHPGKSQEIHKHLYKYFLEQGDSKRAAFQKKQLENMQK
ncbi:hypothetical protein KJ611_04520, partial [Patescibacteria group bacterium]|nr:hypothetical protein [Patescibacteria group bacterium]